MIVLVTVLVVLLALIYHYNNRLCQHWKRMGIHYVPADTIFSRKIVESFLLTTQYLSDVYEKSRGQAFIGFYQLRTPVIMVCDPEMINGIISKDFHSFNSTRKPECLKESDPLSQHLLALNGEKWKIMRSKLSPAFTSGKLKNMFCLIENSVDQCMGFLDKNSGQVVDVRDMCGSLSVATLVTCAFGLESKYSHPNNDKYIKLGQAAFAAGFWKLMKDRFRMMWPRMFHFLGLAGYAKGHSNFCEVFIKEVISNRKLAGIHRPDFVEILIKMQNEENQQANVGVEDIEEGLTDNLIIAQVYSFLVAGYETTTSSLSCCLFELAKHPQEVEKLRQEAQKVVKINGTLNYEGVNQMKYLDQIVKEVLRKHPPVIFLPRVCTKRTTLPGTTLTIEKGTELIVPVFALHRDPYYYPEPYKFVPDRFADNEVNFPNIPYLPFGGGPRKCIGMRFALLEIKLALARIALGYHLRLDESTNETITMENYARIYKVKDNIRIIFQKHTETS